MASATHALLAVPLSVFRDYLAMIEWLGPIDWRDFSAGYRAMEAFYAECANSALEHRDRHQKPLRKAS